MWRPLVLAALVAGAAYAEVKVINGTGQELTLDVLSQQGKAENVKLAVEPSPSFVIGPKTPPTAPHQMVVKLDGAEQHREEVNSGYIYIVKKWNPFLYQFVGYYQPQKANTGYPRVVNAVGQQVDYEVTYSDFSQSKSSIPGPDGNATVVYGDVGSSRNAGEVIDVVLKPVDGGAPLTTKLKCGVVYFLSRGADGNLKLEPIGTH